MLEELIRKNLCGRALWHLPMAEFVVLVGLRVTEIPPERGTPADILARFDLGP